MSEPNELNTDPVDTGGSSRGSWLWQSRSTGALAVIGCIGLAVIVVVAVTLALVRNHSTSSTTAPVVTPAPGTSSADSGDQSGFAVAGSDVFGRVVAKPNNPRGQALPQDHSDRAPFHEGDIAPAPAGMMWQQVGPFVLPFSTSDGPTRIEGPIATGYTQTPQGAALAGQQIWWHVGIDGETFDEVVARQVDPGSRTNLPTPKPSERNPDWSKFPQFYRPDAFRVVGWSADSTYAVVEYALRKSVDPNQPGWFSSRAELSWQDGDWKIVVPATEAPSVSVPALVGWTKW